MGDHWIVDNPLSQRYPLYTRGNVGEVFPDVVAPLTWTAAGIPGAEQGWRDAWKRFGAFDDDEFAADNLEVLGVFGGYCYLNVSLSRIFAVRAPGLTPEMMDTSLFGSQPGALPYQPQPTDESPGHSEKIGATLAWIMTATELPQLVEEQEAIAELRAARPDLSTLTDRELLERAMELIDIWFRRLFAQHLFTTYCAFIPLGVLSVAGQMLGDPGLAMQLSAGLGGVDSAAPSLAMWDLGRMVAASPSLTAAFEAGLDGVLDRVDDGFRSAFEGFIYEYGSRGPNEWEFRCPTWETNPELALTAIDRMRVSPGSSDPRAHQAQLAAQREAKGAAILELLAGDAELSAQFQGGLQAAKVFFPGRERSKTTIVRMLEEVRVCLHEFGRRMVAAGHFDEVGDFGMLTRDELMGDPTAHIDAIRERRARWQELNGLTPPFTLNAEYVPTTEWERRADHHVASAGVGDVLTGIPGCPGSVEGRARIVRDPFDGGDLNPGEVLIAPSTDPSWTPLFVPAAAVVVNVGAQMSHAIIVSRELGIPCVVSVTDATDRIPDGATVRVDGSTGEVTVLRLP